MGSKKHKKKMAKLEKELHATREERDAANARAATSERNNTILIEHIAGTQRNPQPTSGVGWHTASDGLVIVHDPPEAMIKEEDAESNAASEDETMAEGEPSSEDETMTKSDARNKQPVAREAIPEGDAHEHETQLEAQPQRARRFTLKLSAAVQKSTNKPDEPTEPAEPAESAARARAPAMKRSRRAKPPIRGERVRTRSDKESLFYYLK